MGKTSQVSNALHSQEREPSGHSWVIYKRYSNFVDLHETLVPYFKAEALTVPSLPPKIANEASAQRNQALTQRKN